MHMRFDQFNNEAANQNSMPSETEEPRIDFGEVGKVESTQEEKDFATLQQTYEEKKAAYDKLVADANESGTYHNAEVVTQLDSKRQERNVAQLDLEGKLRFDPKLAREVYKKEWRQLYADQLRSGRYTYDDIKSMKGPGGAPKTRLYELADATFDGDSGVFDGDARNAVTDEALEEAHQHFLEDERTRREAEEGEKKEQVELPQQKEAVSASNEKPKKEFSKNPEMDAYIRDTYLSYADAPVSSEEKERMLAFTRESGSAQKYAESLRHLAERRNLSELDGIGRKMIEEVKKVLAKLGLKMSAYGESRTWALWDIAKQEYFAEHSDENDGAYKVGGIFELPEKKEEIVNRHTGWEVYKAHSGGERAFLERLRGEGKEEIMGLLAHEPKENGTLSSYELARLGELIKRAVL